VGPILDDKAELLIGREKQTFNVIGLLPDKGAALRPAAVTEMLMTRRQRKDKWNEVLPLALIVLIGVGMGPGLTACNSPPSQSLTLPTASIPPDPATLQSLTPVTGTPQPSTPPGQTPSPTPANILTPAFTPVSIHLSSEVPVYSQLTTLPVKIGGKTVNTKWSSCGPASLAMVLNYQRTGPTPQDIVDYAFGAGLYRPGDPEKVYASPENLYNTATNYGMPVAGNVTTDEKAAQALLREKLSSNLPVIVDVTVALRTQGGTTAHFVVVTGTDANDVYVNDPYTGGTGGSSRTIPFKDFFWAWQHNSDAARNSGGGWWMTVIPK
jgi:predicted double-glycine peptidase